MNFSRSRSESYGACDSNSPAHARAAPTESLIKYVFSEDSDTDLNFNRAEVQVPDECPEDGSINDAEEHAHVKFSWRTLWAYTGPGFLMSIAYLDPGNLESDLQAGAYTGYQLIWVLFWSTVIGLILQIMAARLGVVTGLGLAELCRKEYSRPVSMALWVLTEMAIIGSDIQEVIGSAIAFRILFGLPLWAGALITGVDTFTFLGLHAFGIRKLEALFGTLIGTMAICFFVDFGYSQPPFAEIAKGFLPSVSSYAIVQAVGIIGAVIMPHNIYLHSALVQSRQVDRNRPYKVREANKYFAIESAVALFVSFLINMAIVSVFAHGFYDADCARQGKCMYNGECTDIGLMRAGDALKGLLGNAASIVWAVGLLAAGQSSVMAGTFAGQFVMEGFLEWNIAAWKRVVITRAVAIVPAIAVALASESNATAGDQLDQWLNVLQSVILPFALIPVLHFTSSRRIMGRYSNHLYLQILVWVLAAFICGVNVYLVVDYIFEEDNPTPHTWWFYSLCFLLGLAYFIFIGFLVREDVKDAVGAVRLWWKRNHSGQVFPPAIAAMDDGMEAPLVQKEAYLEAGAAQAGFTSYSTNSPS